MAGLDTLDLKSFIAKSVYGVFDTMLSMPVEASERDFQQTDAGRRIVGSVGFAGKVLGNVSIHVNEEFSRLITAAMLGMEVEEIEGDEEIHDVIGELSNMVGGEIKSRLCDEDLNCELSIPSITSGSDFRTETKGWERHERFVFQNGVNVGLVEVFVKADS
ncbi:MAG: chemotaxis protein CheX [Desulfobacteraceae bacterium]